MVVCGEYDSNQAFSRHRCNTYQICHCPQSLYSVTSCWSSPHQWVIASFGGTASPDTVKHKSCRRRFISVDLVVVGNETFFTNCSYPAEPVVSALAQVVCGIVPVVGHTVALLMVTLPDVWCVSIWQLRCKWLQVLIKCFVMLGVFSMRKRQKFLFWLYY